MEHLAEPIDLMQILKASLRRTRSSMIVVGFAALAFAYIGYGLFWLKWDSTATLSPLGAWLWGSFLVLIGAFGVMSVYRGSQLINLDRAPIMQTLNQHPERIVWIYQNITKTRGTNVGARHYIYVWMLNGRPFSIDVTPDNAKMVIQAVHERAPHALVGYTPEHQQMYNKQVAAARR
jgi:hypothetical protein